MSSNCGPEIVVRMWKKERKEKKKDNFSASKARDSVLQTLTDPVKQMILYLKNVKNILFVVQSIIFYIHKP